MQLVLMLPVLMLLVWAAMQAAMFFYGRTAAISAAHTGAAAAAAATGSTSDCRAAAGAMLDQVGDAIRDVRVDCQRTPTRATATITGSILSVVPGWTATITHTASAPVERLTR
ncbi:MAG: pilus assembly protein [Micropruina sp.]|nr:pilus assembly protein [Micropruina sp.]